MKRKEKGITLIALVITIIVMLILVGVTVNIAFKGNLFGITKSATKKYNMEQAKEEVETSFIKYKVQKYGDKTLKEHLIEDLGIDKEKTIYYSYANAIAFWYKDLLFVLDGNDGQIKAIGGNIVKSNAAGDLYEDLLEEGKYIVHVKSNNGYAWNGPFWVTNNDYNGNVVVAFISPEITDLHDHSFYGCSSLRNVYLSDELAGVGDYCFYKCSALGSVTLPSGVSSLGDFSFASSGLMNIDLPDAITSIGNSCFSKSQIKCLYLPERLAVIPTQVVCYCSSLECIYVPLSVSKVEATQNHGMAGVPIYYAGNQENWKEIEINDYFSFFSNKKWWYLYSKEEPVDKETNEFGGYWHYVNGQIEKW